MNELHDLLVNLSLVGFTVTWNAVAQEEYS